MSKICPIRIKKLNKKKANSFRHCAVWALVAVAHFGTRFFWKTNQTNRPVASSQEVTLFYDRVSETQNCICIPQRAERAYLVCWKKIETDVSASNAMAGLYSAMPMSILCVSRPHLLSFLLDNWAILHKFHIFNTLENASIPLLIICSFFFGCLEF